MLRFDIGSSVYNPFVPIAAQRNATQRYAWAKAPFPGGFFI